jgi:hypothetical protein
MDIFLIFIKINMAQQNINFDLRLTKGGPPQSFVEALYRGILRWPPVKTNYQKLIKTDILLSRVKLNKMSMATSPSKQNIFSPKNTCKKIGP